MHILFIGYGKTSQRVVKHLFAQGHQITAVSRSEKSAMDGVRHLQQDIHQLDVSQVEPIDCVYVLLSPEGRTVEDYQQTYLQGASSIIQALKSHPIQRCIVVSSTRVYNSHVGGTVVDDETVIDSDDAHGRILYAMEQAYIKAFAERCVIVRPSGIYGASVARMIKMAQSTQNYYQCHWSNRIHIDDLARFLAVVYDPSFNQQCYIASDSRPYPLHEIIQWFQDQLGIERLLYEPQQETGKKIYATHLTNANFELTYSDCFFVYKTLLEKEKAP